MKKSGLAFLFFGILFAPLVTHADFPDVPVTHPSYEAISALEELKVIQGFPDGQFKPEEPVDRSQFLKMAYLAEAVHHDDRRWWTGYELFPFGKESTIKIDPPCFGDLKGTEWFEPYVCWGKEQGLVSGDGNDGLFHPLREVNFAESSKILVETSGYPSVRMGDHWAEGYIEALGIGVIPPSIKSADQFLTRGQVAELIWGYTLADQLILQEKKGSVFDYRDENFIHYDYLGSASRTVYLQKDDKIYAALGLDFDSLKEVDADIPTFKINFFSGEAEGLTKKVYVGVPTDRFGVFNIYGKRIEGSRGGSFTFFENSFYVDQEAVFGYARDDQYVYSIFCYEGCGASIIPGSDAGSFEASGQNIAMDKNGVYTFGGLSELRLELIGTVERYGMAFEHYLTDGEKLYVVDNHTDKYGLLREVEGADLETFRIEEIKGTGRQIALDDTSLYWDGSRVKGSKGGQFELLDEEPFMIYETLVQRYARDSDHIYILSCYEWCGLQGPLPDSDTITFEALGDGYSKDKNQVYYIGKSLPESSPDTFERLLPNNEGLYCTFPYSQDGEHVFFREKLLLGVDLNSFEFLDPYGFFFKDKNYVYRVALDAKGDPCYSPEWTMLSGIDGGTFEYLSPYYFKSGGQIFHTTATGLTTLMSGADYDTFEPLVTDLVDNSAVFHSYYAKDKNNAYYNTQIIPDIDVPTFEYDYNLDKLKDKNGVYGWMEISKKLGLN